LLTAGSLEADLRTTVRHREDIDYRERGIGQSKEFQQSHFCSNGNSIAASSNT